MKSKVKTQRRSFDYLAIIGAIIWMSPSAFAKTCETGGCVVPSTVDCSTYGSIILEDSVSGIPVTHNALIGSAQMSNCGYNPITPYFSGTYLVNYAISESISHSASGTYTLSIGAKVGNEAVGQLGLNHSTTHSNGWQKQNAYTSSTSTSWNYQVPPHKIDGADYYGDWSDGTFTAGKYMRTWYFDDGTGSWENTECNNSSSTASGANKVYKNVHGVARSRQDC